MHGFAPFPIGTMPPGIEPIPGDSLGRIRLDLVKYPDWLPAVLQDQNTGHWFVLERADCGGGCRCAATARWVHG